MAGVRGSVVQGRGDGEGRFWECRGSPGGLEMRAAVAVLEVWKLVTAVNEAGQKSTSTERPKWGPSSAHTCFSCHSHFYTKKRCSGVQDMTRS